MTKQEFKEKLIGLLEQKPEGLSVLGIVSDMEDDTAKIRINGNAKELSAVILGALYDDNSDLGKIVLTAVEAFLLDKEETA